MTYSACNNFVFAFNVSLFMDNYAIAGHLG